MKKQYCRCLSLWFTSYYPNARAVLENIARGLTARYWPRWFSFSKVSSKLRVNKKVIAWLSLPRYYQRLASHQAGINIVQSWYPWTPRGTYEYIRPLLLASESQRESYLCKQPLVIYACKITNYFNQASERESKLNICGRINPWWDLKDKIFYVMDVI